MQSLASRFSTRPIISIATVAVSLRRFMITFSSLGLAAP
jgi:hypothetical protein